MLIQSYLVLDMYMAGDILLMVKVLASFELYYYRKELPMNRAILIIIDGCRVDAMQQVQTAHIESLVSAGASSFKARTVTPPITLPSHFSLFTSSHPISHGVYDNSGRPLPSPSVAGFVEVLAYHHRHSAAFFTWEHLRNLWPPGAINFSLCSNVVQQSDSDHIIADLATNYIVEAQPDFCFIYLERTDFIGHAEGWMSTAYLNAVENADKAVGRVLSGLQEAGLRDGYHIIIQSDHGGQGNHHTHPDDAVMTIPWIAVGPNIRAGHIIQEPVSIVDTVPTIARIMGIQHHLAWEGKIVGEIFVESEE